MIPEGTTSRQLAALCRWTLATVLMAGALCWWWSSARSWGAMAGGLLVVFVLWVAWKAHRGETAAPSSLFHLALLGPAVLWSAHFLPHALMKGHDLTRGIEGTLDITEIYQLGLLALSATLTQDLFARRRGRDLPILLCGTAMVVGALAATFWGKAQPLRVSMNYLAFAGVSLWVSVLYSHGQRPPKSGGAKNGNANNGDATLFPAAGNRVVSPFSRATRHPIRLAAIAAIVVMFIALDILFPAQGGLAAGLFIVIAIMGRLFLAGRRAGGGRLTFLVLLAWFAALWTLLVWFDGLWTTWADFASSLAQKARGWSALGAGGGAFGRVSETTSGLEFLGDAVGWAGLAWLAVGILAAAAWALWRARGSGEGLATIFRLWAAGLATAAMVAPNGEFVPSVTLAVGFTWGLLFARPAAIPGAMPLPVCGEGHVPAPQAQSPASGSPLNELVPTPGAMPGAVPAKLGTPPYFRGGNRVASPVLSASSVLSGWVLLALAGTLVLFLAVAPDEGLAGWSGKAVGLGPTFLHVSCGFLVALVLAWQMGSGRVWTGILGIALAIAAGGGAELAQLLTATRTARFGDFLLTSSGCLAACVPYLLAMGARLCEED